MVSDLSRILAAMELRCPALGSLMSNFELYFTIDVNMAYDGNTAANVSLPVGVYLDLQTWSRKEPGWVEGTYSSFDEGDLQNSA